MDDVKQQVADRLKQATSILVTVKTDPTIDLLAACIGLSLVLDKIGKHATAVFSGQVPSAMEFLKPEETIEQTPNSLRDFIISLDKSKADKLRYKVEDKVVRIFITPFKSALTQEDFEFSQGDFNIDLLVALGVHEQAELDAAVTAHGRILHDAGIISINVGSTGNLGTLNWQGTNVSSVSEMVADLASALDKTALDEQIATALLTGIVSETARFSNDKTSPHTMQIAGDLMAAGANQQLVATELQATTSVGAPGSVKADVKPAVDAGTLEIKHELPPADLTADVSMPELEPAAGPAPEAAPLPEPKPAEPAPIEPQTPVQQGSREILPMPDPATAGDTAVSDVADTPFTGEVGDENKTSVGSSFLVDRAPEAKQDATAPTAPASPMTELPPVQLPPLPSTPADSPDAPSTPVPSSPPGVGSASQTLQEIEASVHSSHVAPETPAAPDATPVNNAAHLDEARQQVLDALKQGSQPLEPIAALGASAPTTISHDEPGPLPSSQPVEDEGPAQPVTIDVDQEGNMTTVPLPAAQAPVAEDQKEEKPAPTPPASGTPPEAPPPVPPPMMPPFGQ